MLLVCVHWVSARVCFLTSSPFSPPGRHILRSPCGWSHVCSERLRETEHNKWLKTASHRPPTCQTNHFWAHEQFSSFTEINIIIFGYLCSLCAWADRDTGLWKDAVVIDDKTKPFILGGLLSSSLIHIINMQHWVLNSAQASRSLKIAVNLLR